MCMRRNGTACETAHFMVPPVGVTENPSAAFQNVQVALFLGRVASEGTMPVLWPPAGEPPSIRSCIVAAAMDELKISTLGPKWGSELPAAIIGPTEYASRPRISLNLTGTPRSPIQHGSPCIDVAIPSFSLGRNS